MELTIFKKTGEVYRDGDWDGDEGYNIEVEIPDSEVERDILEMVMTEYFPQVKAFGRLEFETVRQSVRKMIDDLDLWDGLKANYTDELQKFYQDGYGD